MNIKHRIAIFPLLTVILLLVTGFISYLGFAKFQTQIENIYQNVKVSNEISGLRNKFIKLNGDIFKVIVWTVANYEQGVIDKVAKQAVDDLQEIITSAKSKGETSTSRIVKESYANMLKPLENYQESVKKAMDIASADVSIATMLMSGVEEDFKNANTIMSKCQEELLKEQSAAHEASKATHRQTQQNFWLTVVGAVIITGILALLVMTSIIKPIVLVTTGLSQGADQMASVSVQVSSTSKQLADGTSEQAAAVEETSSSLEEVASMTRQNADNADRCQALMRESKQIVGTVHDHMNGMGASIEEISRSSEDTIKIIKTIDEIAFQTNLLALNAAVEAARAGEVGAGFAVVADEVRNLAMRAAEAARTTNDLIDNTVRTVREGAKLTKLTRDAFEINVANTMKVDEIVNEIAAASREQVEGIEQINRAAANIDKVTQQNAANAEQSAATSVEMNMQAEHMKGFVEQLAKLIGRASNGNGEQRQIGWRLFLKEKPLLEVKS